MSIQQQEKVKAGPGEASPVSEDVWIPTTCWGCVEGPCLLRVRRVNGVAVEVQGNRDGPDFERLSKNKGRVCPKPFGLIQRLYNPNRVKAPMKRTNPEKGIGIDPKWVEISWDEALDIVAGKMKEVRASDSRRLCTGVGGVHSRLNVGSWRAFLAAYGQTQELMGGHGIRCDMAEHNFGNLIHGGFQCEPDTDYCNYLLIFGHNTAASGGAPENVLFADAREKHIKTVVIDPVLTPTGSKADEWIPIKPGTDTAMMLGLINVIIHELKHYDTEFLKHMTNSPYLVKADGYFARDKQSNKPLVWDAVEGKAKAFDADVKDFALEGSYQVDGAEVKTAFQLLKEHVAQYTPEWASGVTDVPVTTIRRVAKEYVAAAMIGSTIKIGDETFPYRPVGTKIGRGLTGVMRSYHTILAVHILVALVGALEVPGGHMGGRAEQLDRNRGIVPGPDGMIEPETFPFTWPPISYGGLETLVPYAKVYGHLFHLGWKNLVDPPKNFPMPPKPEIYFRARCNPLLSIGEPEIVAEGLKSIPFVVSVTYVQDEVSDFADILLPDRTELERTEIVGYVRSALGKKYFGTQLRQEVVKPLHNTMDFPDILTELAARIGILAQYNKNINGIPTREETGELVRTTLSLNDPYRLEPGKKYSWLEIEERHCKSLTNGACDLEWFKKHGAILREATINEQYDVHLKMRNKKLRYYIPYLEHVKKTGEELAKNLNKVGIDWWPTSEYLPLPTYIPSVAEKTSAEYDFYVTTFKSGQFSMGYNIDIPWLIEASRDVAGHDRLLMNAAAGAARGIKDGDFVWVESEVGKMKAKVKLCQGIRPDTLAVTQQFGQWRTPVAKDTGRVSLTTLVPIRASWTDHMVSNMQGHMVKAKVYKAKR